MKVLRVINAGASAKNIGFRSISEIRRHIKVMRKELTDIGKQLNDIEVHLSTIEVVDHLELDDDRGSSGRRVSTNIKPPQIRMRTEDKKSLTKHFSILSILNTKIIPHLDALLSGLQAEKMVNVRDRKIDNDIAAVKSMLKEAEERRKDAIRLMRNLAKGSAPTEFQDVCKELVEYLNETWDGMFAKMTPTLMVSYSNRTFWFQFSIEFDKIVLVDKYQEKSGKPLPKFFILLNHWVRTEGRNSVESGTNLRAGKSLSFPEKGKAPKGMTPVDLDIDDIIDVLNVVVKGFSLKPLLGASPIYDRRKLKKEFFPEFISDVKYDTSNGSIIFSISDDVDAEVLFRSSRSKRGQYEGLGYELLKVMKDHVGKDISITYDVISGNRVKVLVKYADDKLDFDMDGIDDLVDNLDAYGLDMEDKQEIREFLIQYIGFGSTDKVRL